MTALPTLIRGAFLRIGSCKNVRLHPETGCNYPIVFHVHDEAIMEVPVGKGSLEEACRIMAIPPDWAKDLPLRADGDEMPYYRK